MTHVLTIRRRAGAITFPFLLIRWSGTITYATTWLAVSVAHNMMARYEDYPMIQYILEVSKTKPTQFRVSVVRSDADYAASASTDFTFIGIYDSPDELTDALEPYLHMEEGS